ncbi:2350_t:CDS:1, partial [Funneliformis geosporum]
LRVWRTSEEEFNYRLGPLILLRESVTGQRYAKVLQRHASPSIYKLVSRK